MGKSSPKMPAAPDPTKTIAAQSQANKEAIVESARVNAVNQYGPTGSVEYQKGADGVPISVTTSLNPDAQAAYDQQQSIARQLGAVADGRIQGIADTKYTTEGLPYDPRGYDTSGMSQWDGSTFAPYDPTAYGDIEAYNARAGDAVYGQATSRLDPQWQQREQTFEQTMNNRGIPVGSEAYTKAREQFDAGRNDAYNQANFSAIQAGGQEASRIMGQEQNLRQTAITDALRDNQAVDADFLQKLQTEQNIRGQVDSDVLKERNQSINEVSAILNGAPAIGMPGAPNVPQYNQQAVNAAGIIGDSYDAQMNAYNAKQASNNSKWQGAFGVMSAFAPKFF